MNYCDIKCLALGTNKHIHKTEENKGRSPESTSIQPIMMHPDLPSNLAASVKCFSVDQNNTQHTKFKDQNKLKFPSKTSKRSMK